MRILCISHSSPLNEGGAETRTREVAFRLARLGHQVTVLCGKTQMTDPPEAHINGVTILTRKTLPDWLLKRFPYPHYLPLAAANLLLMIPLFFFLRREKFDIIREDIAPFPPSFLLALVRVGSSQRLAVVHMLQRTLRGWVQFYGPLFGFGGYLMNRLLRANLLKYDRIISDSKWFADELQEYPGIADKVSYVPNGVDVKQFDLGRKPASNGRIRLLSVGRLVDTKGHRYAIEALAECKDTAPLIQLDILGKGPLQEYLNQLAKERGVQDRVSICPPVSHQLMPELFTEYDFFVMPSLWEGLPVSLIEAMAARLPVIATNIPAITAVLDETSAVLVEMANAQDLAEKLRWAIAHPEAVRQLAETAYARARQYDWDGTVRQEFEGVS